MKFSKITNRNTWVEIISALFIILFVYTAISKLTGIHRFETTLSKSPLLGSIAPFAAWTIPIIELIISILLFHPNTRRKGLYSSLILMVGFTAYLSYMIVFTPELPCACGGVLAMMSWKEHLVFNIVFTLLALIAILLSKNKNESNDVNQTKYSPSI